MSQLDGTPVVIGFDTSNYRTSVAAVTLDGEILVNHRELLPVSSGERGLRQSDAVFAHIRQLRNSEEALREKLKGTWIAAVAASTKPRDGGESYMPVFQVGHTAGSMMAAALAFSGFRYLHSRQQTDFYHSLPVSRTRLFLAVNLNSFLIAAVPCLLMSLVSAMIIQISTGAATCVPWALGQTCLQLCFFLGFCMTALLAVVKGKSGALLGVSLENGDLTCHLSGAETKVQQWIREGSMAREDMAREIYDLLARTLVRMLKAGAEKSGCREALVTGGVAASALLRQLMAERKAKTRGCPEIVFGRPEMSGDNAVGVALIGVQRLQCRMIECYG